MTDEVSFCKNCLEQLNSARLRKQYQTTLICLRWHAKNSAGMVRKQSEVLNAHFLPINFIKFYTIFSHDIDDTVNKCSKISLIWSYVEMNFILNHHIIFDYRKAKRRLITNEKVHLTPSKYIKNKTAQKRHKPNITACYYHGICKSWFISFNFSYDATTNKR